MRRLNKRDYDGRVSRLPSRTTVVVQRKPIKNIDHLALISKADGTAADADCYQYIATDTYQYFFKPANEIAQGTANGERIGNQITMRNLYLTMEVVKNKNGGAVSDNTAGGELSASRLLVFIDTQSNLIDYPNDAGTGSLFQNGGLLSKTNSPPCSVNEMTALPSSLFTMDSRKRFIILYDKPIVEKEWENVTEQNGFIAARLNTKITVNKKIFYDDTSNTGFYNEILKNSLYCVYIAAAEATEITDALRIVRFQSRLTFQDA